MRSVELNKVEHEYKNGQKCPDIRPNIKEDCFLTENGNIVGLYIRSIPDKMKKLAHIADVEFRSKRVPKSKMDRKRLDGVLEDGRKQYHVVSQMSTILGAIPPKPHMKRPYPSISQVHLNSTAQVFVKAMLLLSKESSKTLEELWQRQHTRQSQLLSEVDSKWLFGDLFTSSISNYNISAPFHQDHANVKGTVNVIITKRKNSYGGNLYVPDYDACFDQCDNSLLIYPAWRNMHGVTPIKELAEGGYRNSLVFYALKAFTK